MIHIQHHAFKDLSEIITVMELNIKQIHATESQQRNLLNTLTHTAVQLTPTIIIYWTVIADKSAYCKRCGCFCKATMRFPTDGVTTRGRCVTYNQVLLAA